MRFVTLSCYRQLPLLGRAVIRDAFVVEKLVVARKEHGFELFAWVVMPEHAHVLVRPRAGELLEDALRSIKTSAGKHVIRRWRDLRAPILPKITTGRGRYRFWQKGGGFDRNVRSEAEFCREVRYIHRNPVERELVGSAEEWKWSSVRWWMRLRQGEVECDPPPGDPRKWEGWLGYW